MGLAPRVFMRGHVLRFGEICRARINRCVQVVDLNQDPVRYPVVDVAVVIVRDSDGKTPVNGLTQAREPMPTWSAFRPEPYGSEHPGQRWLPVAQPLVLQPKPQALSSNAIERVFHPGLADLFEALVVIGAAAHPIEDSAE